MDNTALRLEAMKAFNRDFVTRMYVLDTYLGNPLLGHYLSKPRYNIRPVDTEYGIFRKMYKSGEGFNYTLLGSVMSSEENEDKAHFLLRAAVAGIYPDVELISKYNDRHDPEPVDCIDLNTHRSLQKMRIRQINKMKKASCI